MAYQPPSYVAGYPPGAAPVPYPPGQPGVVYQQAPPGAPNPAAYPAPGYPPPYGAAPAGYPPQGYPGYPPQGAYPPQQGYPQQGAYPPQQYPPQGAYPPQQGYPPGQYPPAAYPPGAYPPAAQYPPPGQYPPAAAAAPAAVPPPYGAAPAATLNTTEPVYHGTVKPAPNFNALQDAEALRKAMKGFGSDEKAIIAVLAHRSAAQRLEIIKAFKTAYGKDLIQNLKSELSGNFEDVILALMQERAQYEANCLRKAMKGVGTAENILIEIICTRTNTELTAIKKAYTDLFQRDLEGDIAKETDGHFRRLLISALQAGRPETTTVNVAQAQTDARALYEAGEKRWGTDESKFNEILMSRSYAQLRATFREYMTLSKHDIVTAIEKEMSGDLKRAFKAVAKAINDRPAYFAERLFKSMDGLGTDDESLIRLVVTRCEVDMLEIRMAFESQYGKTLARMIEGDTKGDYKRVLLALIGEA